MKTFLIKLISLSPFGSGNPEPKFVIENLKLVKSQVVGENHIKALFSGEDGSVIAGVTFNATNTVLESYLTTKKNSKKKLILLEN